jgi:RHS repeat-associated protein
VIKMVSPKLASGGSIKETQSTVYVDQYFEVRPNNVPTKYVWNGNTRVAAATGPFSTNQLIQRLSLWTGWNLCALYLSVANAGQQLNAEGRVELAFRWNASANSMETVAQDDALSAGTVLWIRAATNATIPLRGGWATTGPAPHASRGLSFHAGALQQRTRLELFAPVETAVSRFNAAGQRWQSRLPRLLSATSELPEFLNAGEAVFLRTETDVPLAWPSEDLSIRYYHHDHLGSSAIIADRSGRVLEETSFYPFGYPRYEEKFSSDFDPYRFTQKERDAETGLDFFEARYLSSALGRFTRVDPLAAALKSSWLGEPQRLNLYAYCANSPMANIDVSGTDLLAAAKGFGIGVVEGVWESIPDPNPVTMTVSATVGLAKMVEAKSVQVGGVLVETYQGNYKKALEVATQDNLLVQAMDPKTSDEKMGRMIGNATGKALVIVAGAKAGGSAPKGPTPPPVKPPPPPPARVVIGRPMTPSGQFATTQPAIPKPPSNPSSGVPNPLEKPTGSAPMEWQGKVLERHRQAAALNREVDAIADRINKRMRDTQELRDWLTKEGQHDLVRKWVGDIINETEGK